MAPASLSMPDDLGDKYHATQMLVGAEDVVAFEESVVERRLTGEIRGRNCSMWRCS